MEGTAEDPQAIIGVPAMRCGELGGAGEGDEPRGRAGEGNVVPQCPQMGPGATGGPGPKHPPPFSPQGTLSSPTPSPKPPGASRVPWDPPDPWGQWVRVSPHPLSPPKVFGCPKVGLSCFPSPCRSPRAPRSHWTPWAPRTRCKCWGGGHGGEADPQCPPRADVPPPCPRTGQSRSPRSCRAPRGEGGQGECPQPPTVTPDWGECQPGGSARAPQGF